MKSSPSILLLAVVVVIVATTVPIKADELHYDQGERLLNTNQASIDAALEKIEAESEVLLPDEIEILEYMYGDNQPDEEERRRILFGDEDMQEVNPDGDIAPIRLREPSKEEVFPFDEPWELEEEMDEPFGPDEEDVQKERNLGVRWSGPLNRPFHFKTAAEGPNPRVQKFDARQAVKLIRCILPAEKRHEICGPNPCVSIRAASNAAVFQNRFFRLNGGNIALVEKPDNESYDWQKSASFCMRPGLSQIDGFTFESVMRRGRYIVQNEDNDYLKHMWKGAIEDIELATFTMENFNICDEGTSSQRKCWRGYFCSDNGCYLQRDPDDDCTEDHHCRSRKCKVDRIGGLLDGYFVKVCDEAEA